MQVVTNFRTNSTRTAYNAGDLGSIPGLGRSLEKETATHSSILAWRIPWGRKNWTQLSNFHYKDQPFSNLAAH